MVTIEQVIKAYIACNALKDMDLPFKFSYALALLERQIEPVFKAYISAEDKYIKEFAKKDENGAVIYGSKGEFSFESAFDKEKYDEALIEIKEEAADIEIKKRKAKAPENISPKLLMALIDFIDFEEEEDE